MNSGCLFEICEHEIQTYSTNHAIQSINSRKCLYAWISTIAQKDLDRYSKLSPIKTNRLYLHGMASSEGAFENPDICLIGDPD